MLLLSRYSLQPTTNLLSTFFTLYCMQNYCQSKSGMTDEFLMENESSPIWYLSDTLKILQPAWPLWELRTWIREADVDQDILITVFFFNTLELCGLVNQICKPVLRKSDITDSCHHMHNKEKNQKKCDIAKSSAPKDTVSSLKIIG